MTPAKRLVPRAASGAARIAGIALVGVFIAFAATACVGGPNPGSSDGSSSGEGSSRGKGWNAEIAAARQEATTDFERQALADGKISAAEYAEAHERWLSCMREIYPAETSYVKVSLDRRADGLIGFKVDSGDKDLPQEYDAANERCQVGTIVVLAPLYQSMKQNPDNRPIRQVLVDCFKRHGLVDESYTVENFIADEAKSLDPSSAVEYDTSKVTDFNMNSEGAIQCRADPSS
jgi:hypothetical protein